MSLLTIIISLVVIGIVLYVINNFIPLDASVRKILNIVVILVLCVWLLKAFGVWAYLARMNF